MRFYNGIAIDDAYTTYGVDADKGAIVAVRPDGYVGSIAALGDVNRIKEYLGQCVRLQA